MCVLKSRQLELKKKCCLLVCRVCSLFFEKEPRRVFGIAHPPLCEYLFIVQNRCWSVRHTEQRSSAPRASPENLLIVLGGFTFPQMGQLIKTAAPWLTIFQPSDLPDHRVMTFTKS